MENSLIYDASEMKIYHDYFTKYVLSVPEGENPLASQHSNYVFPFTLDKTNPKGIQEMIDGLMPEDINPGEVQVLKGMDKIGNVVKLKYEGETSIWIPDITAMHYLFTP